MAAYKNIVILTGAGISAESGLATFRGADGLWENHPIEDVATPEGFARNPGLVHEFYSMRRAQLPDVAPGLAHRALADLESGLNGDFLIITQNVDDLHERAGSKSVHHMHGELNKIRCSACGHVTFWDKPTFQETQCPSCTIAGTIRPHIVWFGEMPFEMDMIYERLEACDLFVSIGTSGQVYPAAGFVSHIRAVGRAHSIEINLEPSEGASLFHETRHGKAGDLVPEFVTEILRGE